MQETLVDKLWRNEGGEDLAEYGLLVTLVSLAAMAAMKSLAVQVSNLFSNSATSLSVS